MIVHQDRYLGKVYIFLLRNLTTNEICIYAITNVTNGTALSIASGTLNVFGYNSRIAQQLKNSAPGAKLLKDTILLRSSEEAELSHIIRDCIRNLECWSNNQANNKQQLLDSAIKARENYNASWREKEAAIESAKQQSIRRYNDLLQRNEQLRQYAAQQLEARLQAVQRQEDINEQRELRKQRRRVRANRAKELTAYTWARNVQVDDKFHYIIVVTVTKITTACSKHIDRNDLWFTGNEQIGIKCQACNSELQKTYEFNQNERRKLYEGSS